MCAAFQDVRIKDRLKLAAFYAAIAIAIAVGGCVSTWDCERHDAGVTCHRTVYEPA